MLQNSNRRIVKNTIIIYVQVIVTMFTSLIASRIVLQTLGANDFGLYNVVGGVILMFSFISNSMTSTTTRFINYEMGKSNGDLNKVFNISNFLHIVTAIFIFVLLETIGLYYLYNHLNVRSTSFEDAMFVYQVSAVVACLGITNVPYKSLFIAHEQFRIIAFVDILNAILKVILIALLFIYKGNALRFYAVSMSLVTLITIFAYHWMSKNKWPEIVKWNFEWKLKSYKEQLFFNNWNLLSTAAQVGRSQGTHLLINLFFNTTVNAAYAISLQVQQAVATLADNISKAASPQITQNIGAGDQHEAFKIASTIGRVSLLIMEATCFTIFIQLDFVLDLWLGDTAPNKVVEFCICTLSIAMIASTSSGLSSLISGYGKIKWFKIQISLLFFAALVCGFFAYKKGAPSYTILVFFAIADFINRGVQLFLLRRFYGFNVFLFIKSSWLRPLMVFFIMALFTLCIKMVVINSAITKIVTIALTGTLSFTLAYFLGLTSSERNRIVSIVLQKIKR